MAYDAITANEVAVGKPTIASVGSKIKNNFDYLYGQVQASAGASGVPNGSFETDSDNDTNPDNWTVTNYAGGSHSLNNAVAVHGLQCMQFTHPGGNNQGGGYMDSDYITVDRKQRGLARWRYYCSNATMKFQVYARFYNATQVYVAETQLFNSTANPTSWNNAFSDMIDPGNNTYMKLRFICGYTDTAVAGNVYVDDVRWSDRWVRSACWASVQANGTLFVPLYGAGGANGTESIAQAEMPFSGIVRNLMLTADSYGTATLRVNGNDAALSATSTSNNLTGAVAFNKGDLVCWKMVESSGEYYTRIAAEILTCLE